MTASQAVILVVAMLWLMAIGIVMLLALLASWLNPWRYDERNPYRRYCKQCGQQQDQYQHALGGVEWCDMDIDHACRHQAAQARG